MHVRRGDACITPWRRCPPLENYLAPARYFARRYGLRRLFIATDEQLVVDELLWSRMEVYSRPFTTRPFGDRGTHDGGDIVNAMSVPRFIPQSQRKPKSALARVKRSEAADTTVFIQSILVEPETTRKTTIEAAISQIVLDVSGQDIGLHDPLQESGVDSLGAVEVGNTLQDMLGASVKLPSTLLFDYPTVSEMASYVVGQLDKVEPVYAARQDHAGPLSTDFVLKLSGQDRPSQIGSIEKAITQVVHEVSGMEVNRTDPLQEAGVDSLGATELHRQLQQRLRSRICQLGVVYLRGSLAWACAVWQQAVMVRQAHTMKEASTGRARCLLEAKLGP